MTTMDRRAWVHAAALVAAATCLSAAPSVAPQRGGRNAPTGATALTVVLGRPTDRAITLSVLAPEPMEAFVEFGTAAGQYSGKTSPVTGKAGEPFEIAIAPLAANTRYYYRLRHHRSGQSPFDFAAEQTFMTARAAGTTFTFGVQGDSHPERAGKMFNGDLYVRTMELVRRDRPDLYFMLGDDFSIERLIAGKTLSPPAVDQVYAFQRPFVGRMAGSTALFLVNGNHEEAGRVLLDGSAASAPVLAAIARNRFYPLPAPDAFYTGNAEPVEHVGLPRDYYAFTWGDALFVVIDFYWHSQIQVDGVPGGQGGGGGARAGGGGGRAGAGGRGGGAGGNASRAAAGGNRDLWQVTLGDAQYAWFKETLETSRAKFKFVFVHHVMGTGRGGVEVADFYEWGGKDRRGVSQFKERRPTWELPIHQLMVKAGVTVLFQGHDHLFARQEKDGIIYQETPNPADDTYTVFNKDAYLSGDILPNSGYLRVTVSGEGARVDYVRAYLPKDEAAERKDGEVAFSYTVKPRSPQSK